MSEMNKNWVERNPYVYVNDEGYEILIDNAVDERGNENGKYELTMWLAKGGYYDTISTHKTFKNAVKAQNKLLRELKCRKINTPPPSP